MTSIDTKICPSLLGRKTTMEHGALVRSLLDEMAPVVLALLTTRRLLAYGFLVVP